MESIIKRAIEGGYFYDKEYTSKETNYIVSVFMKQIHYTVCDPLFWQALGKACVWKERDYMADPSDTYDQDIVIDNALCFHSINLTEGWDKAVEYLQSIVGSSIIK